jgi:ABC-2 type transport system ATP-binding protein
MNPIIKLENVSKSFGSFKALENLTLTINQGEIFGLIGPNGSGKTTTISIILGILAADHGAKIEIEGLKVPQNIKKLYADIGYMPQDISMYMDLSIKQNLEFFANISELPKKIHKERIEEVLKLVELWEFQDRVLSKCSGGMQRRCSLACALLHYPKILILDEPTVGIDPELRITFWEYFRKLSKEKGTTILITTHYLAESKKCDTVAFINKNIKIIGPPRALQKHVQDLTQSQTVPDMEETFIYYTKHIQADAQIQVLGGEN